MSDKITTLFEQAEQHRRRYCYFLMAAGLSGIAFSVHQTTDLTLSLPMIPQGLAVLLWGVSVYAGCHSQQRIGAAFFINLDMLTVGDGTHPAVGVDPPRQEAIKAGLREIHDRHGDWSIFCGRWQFRLLMLGGIAYLIGHVWMMYDRTKS